MMIMTTILVGIQNSILVLDSSNDFKIKDTSKGNWPQIVKSDPQTSKPQCVAFDPQNPDRAYWGTFDNGLLKTDDRGQSWTNIGKDVISSPQIMSVAVSPLNGGNRFNRIYAGTEPSALYTSTDGGDSCERLEALNNLPSSKTWSFPPRPWTHHIRWIEPDANNSDYIFVAIEAGALVQSHDGGKTWIDRVKGGPYDTHTLATHPKAPKRLYIAAGDGYFESFDYGESWSRRMEGLRHGYLVGLAVDSGNPDVVIVSVSDGPFKSFSHNNAETFVYRKDEDSKGWKVISNGLFEPNGTTASILSSNQKVPGEFYAVNNRGIFISNDSANSWSKLNTEWPKEYLLETPWSLAISD
jgi:hypothetical protein